MVFHDAIMHLFAKSDISQFLVEWDFGMVILRCAIWFPSHRPTWTCCRSNESWIQQLWEKGWTSRKHLNGQWRYILEDIAVTLPVWYWETVRVVCVLGWHDMNKMEWCCLVLPYWSQCHSNQTSTLSIAFYYPILVNECEFQSLFRCVRVAKTMVLLGICKTIDNWTYYYYHKLTYSDNNVMSHLPHSRNLYLFTTSSSSCCHCRT